MNNKLDILRHLHYKTTLRVKRNYEKKTSSLEEKLNKKITKYMIITTVIYLEVQGKKNNILTESKHIFNTLIKLIKIGHILPIGMSNYDILSSVSNLKNEFYGLIKDNTFE